MKEYRIKPVYTQKGAQKRYGLFNKKTDAEGGTFSTLDEFTELLCKLVKDKQISIGHAQNLIIESRKLRLPICGTEDESILKIVQISARYRKLGLFFMRVILEPMVSVYYD